MKKYEIIYNLLLEEIENCLNNSKFSLIPERQMTIKYNVSRQTIRHALNMLERAGYIETIQGSGIYITGRRPSIAADSQDDNLARDERSMALILFSDSEYEYPAFISEITTLLSDKNILINVYNHQGSFQKLRDILSDLMENLPLGIIIEPVNNMAPSVNSDLFNYFDQKKLPIVFLHGCPSNLGTYPVARFDNISGAYELCDYLLRLSHRKIGAILRNDWIQGYEFYIGLSQCMSENGLKLYDKNVVWYNSHELMDLQKKQDTHFITHFLRHHLEDCTAILCQDDEIAYWLVKECQYANLSIPEDISIVSCNSSYLSTLSAPSITGLAPKDTGLAKECIRIMLSRLRNYPIDELSLQYKIIERSTT